MTRINRQAVGVFSDYHLVERVVNDLRVSGFPMERVFVIAPNPNARHWLSGIAVRDRLEDFRHEFPRERVSFYQDRLSQGDYLLVVEGTKEEIHRVESIVNVRGIQDWHIYDDTSNTDRGFATTGRNRRAVGVFRTRREAEDALHELRNSGFPMDAISVIAKDADRNEEIAGAPVRENIGNKADEGATVGAVSGGVVGGLTGLLVGLGILAIPGIGPVMLAGATATTIATTLSGTAIGAVTGGLLGALIGLGIPEERARVYHDRVVRGEYLVIVDGTPEEIATAEAILSRRGIEEYGVYDTPHVRTAPVEASRVREHDAPHVLTAPVEASRVRTVPVEASVPLEASAPLEAPRVREHDAPHIRTAPVEASHASTVPAIDTSRTVPPANVARNKYAIGVFPNLRQAEMAVDDLRYAGFPLNLITLVARNFERREPFSGLELRDRFDAMRMGLPDERAHFYNDRIARGDYMVIVNGTSDEVARAGSILGDRGIQEWEVYDPTTIDYVRPGYTANPTVSNVGLGSHKRAIGLFSHRHDAQQAISDLLGAGFTLSQISLFARHFEPQGPFTGLHLRDRFDAMRMGLPDDRIHFYNDRIAHGDYVVVVHGTEDEVRRAASILRDRGIAEFGIYDAPDYTPGTVFSSQDYSERVVSTSPEVVIIDRREEIL